MTTETSSSHELRMERTLNAPVERVWRALTQADQVARWYGPSDDFRIEVIEWDCRVGGTYKVAMHHESEGQTHTCHGEFRTLEANRRLAYTWAWEGQPPMDTLVTFEISGDAGKTQLAFTHAGFGDAESREQHVMGWTGSLERLTKLVG